MYAIADIETTGGHASGGGITEIAVVLHNGQQEEGRFTSLVNPQRPIPPYISALTGITADMVADAPVFGELAPQLLNLLKGRVFVAHNVNFDYSFLLHHFKSCGIEFEARKLCTVRYARKVIPGHTSYSLGNICRDLNIPLSDRHRAMGDAAATALLFEYLLNEDTNLLHLQSFLKGKAPEQYLPMHVRTDQWKLLPQVPGVYYFKDKAGKMLYVGKAKNLASRVKQHFANNQTGRRKQDFIRNIHDISYQACLTEMHAMLLEDLEIKKWWPKYNRSQKHLSQRYGLYVLHDQRGIIRLAVEKRRPYLPALAVFHRVEQCFQMARSLMDRFQIDERLLMATATVPDDLNAADVEVHNQATTKALSGLREQLSNCLLYEWGHTENGTPATIAYLLKAGAFAGWQIQEGHVIPDGGNIRPDFTILPDHEFAREMLKRFADLHPESMVPLTGESVGLA